jgi:hypothetical protein
MMGRSLRAHPVRNLFLFLFIFAAVSGLALPTAHAGPFVDAGHAPVAMADWATSVVQVVRGPLDIASPGNGLASFGAAENLLGTATGDPGDVVSLGDGGSASLYFDSGISNGPGDDFAVFENGFMDLNGLFAELAYVEVSTNGIDFARFDSDALNGSPVDSFDQLDPTDYHGLAGRHAIGIGTGFDLGDLAFDPLVMNGDVELANVQYVRVVDVLGDGSTLDGGGNPIYDPYSTPFDTGGFDLEAIGVIHVPEPGWATSLLIGLLALIQGSSRMRKRPAARRLGSGLGATLAVGFFASPAASLTATFDDLGLGATSFENGAGLAGGYISGGIFFENDYEPLYESFRGYAASTMTDATTPGFGNQFSNITGSGAGGSAGYGIAYLSGRIVLPTPTIVLGAEFTNTTYAALSMTFGDAFAKQFGGATGNDEDFFRLLIEGIDDGGGSTGTVELMLADYRFLDNSQDFILDEWVFLNLSGLGVVSELQFSFQSSDVGDFGINTPQYFAIDNLVSVPEPATVLYIGLGLAYLARRPRNSDRFVR